ncbi:MAG: ABC transporter permease subunit [Clostridiales bacterium]|jgi:ABC-2 type transport system permease protein|nr:ABC transporter permease subunit [Clostridiales bacterium]
MFNLTLYKKELKGLVKTLVIIGAVLTLYVSVIITMYDPEAMALLDGYVEMLPELMAAVGMSAGATSLVGFMASYLYGFLLLIMPMVFAVLCGNKVIAKYVDKGSMVCLLAAPVKRRAVAVTQLAVLLSGIVMIAVYTTVLELAVAIGSFPGELEVGKLLLLNLGLLCLQLFIGALCFFASCLFADGKYAFGAGAGVPALMFILRMLANTGGKAEWIRYVTFFSLFNPGKLIAGSGFAIAGIFILLAAAIGLFVGAIAVFNKKDLNI